jgi:N-acetylglutamate synthase-like GNAT family acetyltransferase
MELNNLSIRKASWRDLNNLKEFVEVLGYSSETEDFSSKMKSILFLPNYQVYIAEVIDEMAGVMILEKSISFSIADNFVKIIALIVKNEYKNKGIGKVLLQESAKWQSQQKASSVVICLNPERKETSNYFEKQGFKMRYAGFVR